MKDIIPIVYAADNNYVVPTIVSITSLLKNKNEDTYYKIFILDDGLTDNNKSKFIFTNMDGGGGFDIIFISINEELGEFRKITAYYKPWTPATFAYYFVPWILNNYDKCITLDGDTIIQSDLSKLYNTDLSDNVLAAVKSPGMNYNIAAEKQPWLEINRDRALVKCINTGVLLLNLNKLRTMPGGYRYLINETLSLISKIPQGTSFSDQDILNKLFIGRIKYLPLKYNSYVSDLVFASRSYYPFCFSRAEISEALKTPAIIHFTIPDKPWKYVVTGILYAGIFRKYAGLWNKYYALSPLSNNRLKRKIFPFKRLCYLLIKKIFRKTPLYFSIKVKTGHASGTFLPDGFFD
jgi:lipopolysaccharide biosynthesis glycosyltransferase